MSKVIAGLSEEDAISFTSKTSKITIHFNGKIEYKEIIKKDRKSKLECPLKLVYLLIFILEIILIFLLRHRGLSYKAVEFGTIFVLVALMRTINAFASRRSTKRNHAAEHMVYNANRKGIPLTMVDVKNTKIFCEYCGSCQVGNLVFLSILNIPIVALTGYWIPYSIISWTIRNLPKGLPLNPFTHLVQYLLTENPNDFNLFISLLAMNMVKAVDVYKEENGDIGPQAVCWLLDVEVGKLLRSNDFNFDTSSMKSIFNEKNGGLWPPFFFAII